MLSRRRRSERGQTLIATLAFIAFFGVVTVAALSWASATQRTVQNTEDTASGNALGEGVAAFASANATRADVLCDAGGVSQMSFADGDKVLLQTKGCGTGSNTKFGATSGSVGDPGYGSDCAVCLLDGSGTTPALSVNSGSSFLGSSVTVSGDIDINGNLAVGAINSLSASPYLIVQHGTNPSATIGSGGSASPTPTKVTTLLQDPLKFLQEPALTGSTLALPSGSATLSPGIYGLNSSTTNTITGTVTLNSGVYVFTHGLTMASGATLQTGSGQGALLYFGCSTYPIPCSGTIPATDGLTAPDPGGIDLVPPSTGPYAGMSIMFDRGNTAPISLGMGGTFSFPSLTISGTIYAPTSGITMTYTSGLLSYSTLSLGRVIADHMAFAGGGGLLTGETTSIAPGTVGFNGCTVTDDVGSGTAAATDTDIRSAQPRPTTYGNARVVTETACSGGNGLVSFDYGDTGAATTVAITPLANNGLTNNTRPTLSGTATDYVGAATVSVQICSGATAPCTGTAVVSAPTTTVGSTGAWSVAPTTALPGTCAPVSPSTQNGCVYTAVATLTDSGGDTATSLSTTFTVDTVAPTVAVNPASTQANPTSTQPIVFTATFSEAVTGFTSSDVTLGGTATTSGAGITVAPPGQASVYTISVTGVSGNGSTTLSASIPKNSAQDVAGNANTASTGNGAITYVNPITVSATVADSAANYAGYVNPGDTYYVYANPTDTAGTINSVTANVSNLTSGSHGGSTTVTLTKCTTGCTLNNAGGGTTTYAWKSPLETSNSSLGNSESVTVTASDAAGNTATTTVTVTVLQSLTVTAASSNKGTIAVGNSLTFTFSNTLDPSTVALGATTVTFTSTYNTKGFPSGLQPTLVSIPHLINGSISTGGTGWVNATSATPTATATYAGTITQSGNAITFTITSTTCTGTCGTYVKAGSQASFTPTPATTILDLAGNNGTGTATSSRFYIF